MPEDTKKKKTIIIRSKPAVDEQIQPVKQRDETPDYTFKFLVVGDERVGKSNLIIRYADNSYTDIHISSIGAPYKTKTIDIDGKKVYTQAWDTNDSGIKKAKTYSGMHAVIVVFDVTDKTSFDSVKSWINQYSRYPIILVGNKVDLESKDYSNKRVVSTKEIDALAEDPEYNIGAIIETSVKNGTDVNTVFETASRIVIEGLQQKDSLSKKVIEENRPTNDYEKAKDKIYNLLDSYRAHLYVNHQDLFGHDKGGKFYNLFRSARSLAPHGKPVLDHSQFVSLGFARPIADIAESLDISANANVHQ